MAPTQKLRFHSLQEIEDSVRLFRPQTDDPPRELLVDEQSLFARDGMPTDERVDVLHRLALDHASTVASTAVLGLLHAGMNHRERLEVRLE
jgi:hypothetical protein